MTATELELVEEGDSALRSTQDCTLGHDDRLQLMFDPADDSILCRDEVFKR